MGTLLIIGIVILVLSLIPAPKRDVHRKPYTRTSRPKVLPWLDAKRRRKRSR